MGLRSLTCHTGHPVADVSFPFMDTRAALGSGCCSPIVSLVHLRNATSVPGEWLTYEIYNAILIRDINICEKYAYVKCEHVRK